MMDIPFYYYTTFYQRRKEIFEEFSDFYSKILSAEKYAKTGLAYVTILCPLFGEK